VVLEPQQGYRVVCLSEDDLTDLTSARVQIETLVLREATANGDLAWESRLIAVHHTLARTPVTAADDPDRVSEGWAAAHAEFHSALLAGCSNGRLRAIAESLRDSAELYRQWSLPADRGHARDVAAEHRAILDAVLDRDAKRAATVLTAHIEYTTRLLLGGPAGGPDGSRATA
jgi:DNA-binding GntR family transcriptional regulator